MNLIKSFLFHGMVHVPERIKYVSQLNKVLFWEEAVFVDSVHMFHRKTFLWSVTTYFTCELWRFIWKQLLKFVPSSTSSVTIVTAWRWNHRWQWAQHCQKQSSKISDIVPHLNFDRIKDSSGIHRLWIQAEDKRYSSCLLALLKIKQAL